MFEAYPKRDRGDYFPSETAILIEGPKIDGKGGRIEMMGREVQTEKPPPTTPLGDDYLSALRLFGGLPVQRFYSMMLSR